MEGWRTLSEEGIKTGLHCVWRALSVEGWRTLSEEGIKTGAH